MHYRIAAVSYINTLPFLEGIRRSKHKDEFELVLVPPSVCGELYKRGEVDLALVPVGVLDELPPHRVVTDFGIGCDGPVRTVALVSQTELDGIKVVQFDPDSRTSNLLIQVLAKNLWQREWHFFRDDDPERWKSMDGGARIAIGDKVFELEDQYPFLQDLGQAWKVYTGLPFLFAVWVSRPDIPDHVIDAINKAFSDGISALHQIDLPREQSRYLKESISYPFDSEKREALKRFLFEVSELQNISVPG